MAAAIELLNLTKLYPGGQGVRELALTVEPGEIFGFIGPNGAGKTTTIRTLLGLLHPTAGAARVLGLDSERDGVGLRAQVGYLPSDPRLYEGLTVRGLLAYVGRFHRGDVAARRRELVDLLDLDESRRCEDLSLGNRKKAALVAALQHRPRVLILDEPTGGLDPLIQARLLALLAEERAAGATVFFSSHVLSDVERACDRVALLRGGRIVEVSTVAEIRGGRTKRVSARFPAALAAPSALALAGVSGLTRDGARARFLYSGPPTALLAALADDGVDDVTVENPSLEEVVLGQYGEAPGA